MDILRLKDGTEIELQSGASLSALSVLSVSKSTMIDTWDKLTGDNLSEVQILNSNGLVVGNYTNLILISETSVVNAGGSVLTNFNLREKTQQEIDIEDLKNDMALLSESLNEEV